MTADLRLVRFGDGSQILAHTVVLATGVACRMLDAPGLVGAVRMLDAPGLVGAVRPQGCQSRFQQWRWLLFLGTEVTEEGALGDAGLAGDLRDGRFVVPLLREQAQRALDLLYLNAGPPRPGQRPRELPCRSPVILAF